VRNVAIECLQSLTAMARGTAQNSRRSLCLQLLSQMRHTLRNVGEQSND
jgi:hypothetical protein